MCMYTICIGAIKVSILWTMTRIFVTARFRIIAYAVMVYSAVLMFSLMLVNLLWCQPVRILWSCDLTAIQRHCAGPAAALAAEISMSSLNLTNEIIILLLPVPLVLGLKANWRYKAGVCCIFGLGIL